MTKGQSIVNASARSQKRKWLTQPIAKVLRSVAGLILAGLIAVLLTFFTQPTAYAKGLNAHILPDGSVAPPTACAGQDLKTCLMDPTAVTSFQANSDKIQNPLAKGSLLFFVTPPQVTADNGTITALWQVMLDIVDAFIVIILMLNGVKIILGGTVFQYANAVETLPGILLALIAAHISMLIVALFLGLNNVLSTDLYHFVANGTISATQSGIHVMQQDQPVFCSTFTGGPSFIPQCPQDDIVNHISITPTDLNLPNIGDAIGTIGGIAGLIIKILGLMMLGQIIIRLFFINLYIIFAPVGIACWALPGKVGQGLTRMWLQGFISTVLVQFVQVVALIVTQLMVGIIAKYLGNLPGTDPNTLLQLLEIAIIWFILRIPSLFNTAPMRTISEAGQAMGQVAGASFAVGVAELQGVTAAAGGAASLAIGM